MKNVYELYDSIPDSLTFLKKGVKYLIEERENPKIPDIVKCNLEGFAKGYGINIFSMSDSDMNLLDDRLNYFTS